MLLEFSLYDSQRVNGQGDSFFLNTDYIVRFFAKREVKHGYKVFKFTQIVMTGGAHVDVNMEYDSFVRYLIENNAIRDKVNRKRFINIKGGLG